MRRGRGTTTRLGALFLGALLLAPVAAAPGRAGGKGWTRTSTIAPGVKWTRIKKPKGPHKIHIVSVELSRKSTLDVELAAGQLPGFETTSSMASRSGAIAAINGDYALSSGRPVFNFARDGDLEQTQTSWGRNFAVNRDETATFIDFATVTTWLQDPQTGLEMKINKVNAGAPASHQINMFTPSGGSVERPPHDACSARLYPTSPPRMRTPEPGVATDFSVHTVKCRAKRLWPQGGIVIATPRTGTHAAEIAALQEGQPFVVSWSMDLLDVLDTIGGNPTLIEGGAIVESNVNGTGGFFARHPRTGVGTTPDGRVLFVTVDGRQPRYSVGMKLKAFAKLFQSLGADYALNLDGGGSTTMFVNGKVRNRPSDGRERGVSSALLLLPGADQGESGFDQPPQSGTFLPIDSRATWERIVRDPASTGGLADALEGRGVPLSPALRRALERFRTR